MYSLSEFRDVLAKCHPKLAFRVARWTVLVFPDRNVVFMFPITRVLISFVYVK